MRRGTRVQRGQPCFQRMQLCPRECYRAQKDESAAGTTVFPEDAAGGLAMPRIHDGHGWIPVAESTSPLPLRKRFFLEGSCFSPESFCFVVFSFTDGCCFGHLGDQVGFEGGGVRDVRNALLSRPFLLIGVERARPRLE